MHAFDEAPIEARVIEPARLPMDLRELALPGPTRSPAGMARFLLRLAAVQGQVRREIRRRRPDVLVALGGYPSLPGILAARRESVPLLLLEQNRSPGKVVRLFRRWADAIACPHAEAAEILSGTGAVRPARPRIAVTGNPVRASVLAARSLRRGRARDAARRTVLVVGGSQGARSINRAITGALPALRPHRDRLSWIHVAGAADRDEVEAAYRRDGWDARVFDFTAELPALLAGADLAFARSGGTTVAELSAIGVPSILVPYPHHRDRHQLRNASVLLEAGGAILLPEERLGETGPLLAATVFDDPRLSSLEEGALRASRPGAASDVVDLLVQIAGGS